LRPRNRKINDRSGLLNRQDGFESSENDASLNFGMEGHAKMMTHWPRDENGSRSFDRSSNVFGDCDRDCGNSALFDLPLNQSDRLMTNWSGGSEQGEVGPLFLMDCTGDAFGNRCLEPLRIHVVADETEEIRREPANHSFRG
jgi:hypothetical protein